MSQSQMVVELQEEMGLQASVNAVALEALAGQAGCTVSIQIGELAKAVDISPQDVMDKVEELALRWWNEGKAYSSLKGLLADGYLKAYGGWQYVEVDLHATDCGDKLVAALLG